MTEAKHDEKCVFLVVKTQKMNEDENNKSRLNLRGRVGIKNAG